MSVTFRARRAVVRFLLDMSEQAPPGRILTLSDDDIAAAVDYSRRHIIRIRQALESEGVIETQRSVNRQRAAARGYIDEFDAA